MNNLNRSLHGAGGGGGSSQTSSNGGGGKGGEGGAKNMTESQKSVVPFTGQRRGTNFSGMGSVPGENDEYESEVCDL